jgi:hypothetical protein
MHDKLRSRLTYANVMATIAVFIALGGTTLAATGGNFILGQSNSASSTTALSSGTTGPAFKVTSTNTGFATALGLNVPSGHAPFTVNSGAKVANLNADKLDGKDSSAFLDKCPSPPTAKFGRICAGGDGGQRTYQQSLDYCASLGLRLPSHSEAVTLAVNYNVPGLPPAGGTFDFMWTDAASHYVDSSLNSHDLAIVVDEDGGWYDSRQDDGLRAVCVTEPSS